MQRSLTIFEQTDEQPHQNTASKNLITLATE